MSEEEGRVEIEPQFTYPKGFQDDKLPHKGVFSPSQFSMYLKCPRQYEYVYALGQRRPPPKLVMIQGSSVHRGAESTHKATIKTGNPLEYSAAVQSVADYFENNYKSAGDLESLKGPVGTFKDNTLRAFYEYYQKAVPKIRPVKVEETFAHKFGVVPVVGIIDLVDKLESPEVLPEMDGKPLPAVEVVSDLKFTGRKWPPQRIRFESQLTFYAHVIGTPSVRVDFLLDAKAGPSYSPEKTIRTPLDIKLLVEQVEEVVDLVKKGFFPRCDPTQWWCSVNRCGFYPNCRGPR